MGYTTAIFDLDGTLLDTIEDLADAVNVALEAHGLPLRSVDETRASVGNGIAKLIEASVPADADEGLRTQVLADFKAHYAAHCAEKTHPYPGVTEVLAALRERGVKCAVVSNKGDFAVQMLAEKYFGGLLDMALGEREGIPRKPDPAPIRLIMEELGADPGSTVYIGDSEVDIVSADNAGLPHIICSWGFRERGFLIERGAKVMVDTADELLDAILH